MLRRLLWIALAALAIAAVAALVYLVRAGDPGATNCAIDFELRSSDNGVLFQFAQDVFAGRALDWSFSPQVFVFPEIPISLVAYVLAGGTVQLYFLIVAAIDTALLFLGLFAVIRYLFPAESLSRRLARGRGRHGAPAVLPLLGRTWLFEYAVAPTYYFGMYLMILVAPVLFFGRSRGVRVATGLGIALTAAANPPRAGVHRAGPCLRAAGAAAGPAGFDRCAGRPRGRAERSLLAVAIRLAFFGRLQGGSPLRLRAALDLRGSGAGYPVVPLGAVGRPGRDDGRRPRGRAGPRGLRARGSSSRCG
ncbi:MAG: hypothetical protein WDM88_04285 [Galbitalea sp.]